MNRYLLTLYILTSLNLVSQQKLTKQPIDIQKYTIQLSVNEASNRIEVNENITINFKAQVDTFFLDLVQNHDDSLGMKVSNVFQDQQPLTYFQRKNRLYILPNKTKSVNELTFKLQFSGIPENGLFIGQNKFGKRTYFGDNWPMRAKHWFACIDHPSDKALVRFEVDAPEKYQVIANGLLISTEKVKKNRKRTIYETKTNIPTKVMVVGIAELEINKHNYNKKLESSTWLYPENKKEGLKDFAMADSILAYYERKIAPYPFEKIAHVQSTTMYGGMENASCIFYDENVIRGEGRINELIAHELVHQWFGNSVTELDWSHLWLSEGFATYLTNLYIEDTKGTNAFKAHLSKDRMKVITFENKTPLPLQDTISTDVQEMLNTNAYQKGSWILHMLRDKMGEELFWKTVATYYNTFAYKNATSKDFFTIAEQVYKQNLTEFYSDWVLQAGHPIILGTFASDGKKATININQDQKALFHFPIEINIQYEDNTSEIKTFSIKEKQSSNSWETAKKIIAIKLDPNFKLLFEEKK
jgi:aminopeptidase N